MKNLLLILFAFITVNSFSQTNTFNDKPYIEVSGQADTLVVPNKIWISIFLAEKDLKGKKSIEEAETEIIQKLQEIGINTEKDLSINDISSNYKNYFFKQTDILKVKSYSVMVTNAKTAFKVFIALENIGISNVRIEKTENSEEKKMQLLINGKAAENAKQIAESICKPLNQKIGNAFQIVTLNYLNQNQVRIRGASTLNEVVVTSYGSRSNANFEPDIQFEKIKISSNVQVKFLLE